MYPAQASAPRCDAESCTLPPSEALFPPTTRRDEGDIVSVIIPAYREDPEELKLSLSCYTATQLRDEEVRRRLELFIILDGHDEDQPEASNPTLAGLQGILWAGATSKIEVVDTRLFRVYRGWYCGVPFGLYIKRAGLKRGKRFSQLFYYEMTQVRRHAQGWEPYALFQSDSDTSMERGSLKKLIDKLDTEPSCAAATGQVLPLNFTANSVVSPYVDAVAAQVWEYTISGIIDKSFFAACKSVLVMPGAFSILRYGTVKDCWPAYSTRTRAGDLISLNCLDLGEDRYLTTLLLMSGHETSYVEGAVAYTHVPQTWRQLLVQRRRWYNSAVLNDVLLALNWRVLCRLDSWRWLVYVFMVWSLLCGVLLQPAMTLALFATADLPTDQRIAGYPIRYHSYNSYGLPYHCPIGAMIYVILAAVMVVLGALMLRNPRFHASALNYVFLVAMSLIGLAAYTSALWLMLSRLSYFALLVAVTIPSALLVAIFIRCRPMHWFRVLVGGVMGGIVFLPVFSLVIPMNAITNLHNGSWGTREKVKDAERAQRTIEAEARVAAEERRLAQEFVRREMLLRFDVLERQGGFDRKAQMAGEHKGRKTWDGAGGGVIAAAGAGARRRVSMPTDPKPDAMAPPNQQELDSLRARISGVLRKVRVPQPTGAFRVSMASSEAFVASLQKRRSNVSVQSLLSPRSIAAPGSDARARQGGLHRHVLSRGSLLAGRSGLLSPIATKPLRRGSAAGARGLVSSNGSVVRNATDNGSTYAPHKLRHGTRHSTSGLSPLTRGYINAAAPTDVKGFRLEPLREHDIDQDSAEHSTADGEVDEHRVASAHYPGGGEDSIVVPEGRPGDVSLTGMRAVDMQESCPPAEGPVEEEDFLGQLVHSLLEGPAEVVLAEVAMEEEEAYEREYADHSANREHRRLNAVAAIPTGPSVASDIEAGLPPAEASAVSLPASGGLRRRSQTGSDAQGGPPRDAQRAVHARSQSGKYVNTCKRRAPRGVTVPVGPAQPFAPIDKIGWIASALSRKDRRTLVFWLWLLTIIVLGFGFACWRMLAAKIADESGKRGDDWDLTALDSFTLAMVSVFGPVPYTVKVVVGMVWAGMGRQMWPCWMRQDRARDEAEDAPPGQWGSLVVDVGDVANRSDLESGYAQSTLAPSTQMAMRSVHGARGPSLP
ncbi:unnamed protein product [Pedinophyceae sp. YPF-701]|nr:unnamed protein product [Pedinophyceae sp. YPF-701]